MNQYALALSAAFACAVCNGAAAVLQKISADKEKNVKSLDASFLWRLIQDKPYLAGIGLDLLGWGFTLYAVRLLPLFLVEAIIAMNIVITALLESLLHRRALPMRVYIAISVVLAGLILLAVSSAPEHAEPVSNTLRLFIVFAPLFIGLAGYFLVRSKSYRASVGLAALGGLAYGGTSVIGRIFEFYHPLWHTIVNPLAYSLIASGALGILLFSIALQRAQATVMNATMTVSQTIIPSIIGVVFLDDAARHGLWAPAIIGTAMALGGVIILILPTPNAHLR